MIVRMKAKFRGSCAECYKTIKKNSPIDYNTESKKAIHAKCPKNKNKVPARAPRNPNGGRAWIVR